MVWLCLFNGISIPYGLFKADILFICKLDYNDDYTFNIPLKSILFNHTWMRIIICLLYLVAVCIHKTFLSNTDNF